MGADMQSREQRVVEAPVVDGHVPPSDLRAEGAVLSALMLKTGSCPLVVDRLKPEHFYSEAHRRIYEAILWNHERGKPTDIVHVLTRLRDDDQEGGSRLAQVGGYSYVTEVLNGAPFVENIVAYADIVRAKAKKRRVIAAAQIIVARGYLEDIEADEYANAAAQVMNDIALEERPGSMVKLLDALKEAVAQAKDPERRGIPTGYGRYDRMTGGVHESDLTIIAARPGMGKTSLVLNMAANIAQPPQKVGGTQWGVAIFSIEMLRAQLAGRMACSEGKVDVSKLRTGFMTPNDWGKIMGAATALGVLPIWIDDASNISLLDMHARVRQLQASWEGEDQRAKRRIGVVIVDYLQLMKVNVRGSSSREQEIAALSGGLKRMAKELRVSVIALSQLNRAVETRSEKSKRPQLSDLRESGAIEQDADNICFIYRDEYYHRETTQERNIAELIVAKQRNGPTGIAKVRFDSEYTRFDNLADGEYVDDEGG